jgi:hypothetical protein
LLRSAFNRFALLLRFLPPLGGQFSIGAQVLILPHLGTFVKPQFSDKKTADLSIAADI